MSRHERLRMGIGRLGLNGLTLGLLAATLGCAAEPVEPEVVVRPVRYQQVTPAGQQLERTFSGVARASVESTLSFRVAGTIDRVAVKIGDRVRRGQLIASVDPTDYEIQLSESEAALRQAEAQARNAMADLERVRALYENSNASADDLDAARATADSMEAQVESVGKRLDLARRQLAFTRLTAPVDGAVAERSVEVNENVRAGQAIVRLSSGSAPEVGLAIPEQLITQVETGSSVQVTFDAIPGRRFAAVVSEVGVASTGTATTFPATVRLEEDEADVRPGMAAEVTFEFSTGNGSDRYLLPPQAVGEDRQGRFVFVAERQQDDLGVVQRRPVQVGELLDEGLEVLGGLRAGELVVTAGVSRLEDGQQVRLPRSEES